MDLERDRGMRILYIPIVYHRQMNPIRPLELSTKIVKDAYGRCRLWKMKTRMKRDVF